MGTKGNPSLTEFAEANARRYANWMTDVLPDEVRQQILDSPDVSTATIVKWLRSLGYAEATENKVQKWRRDARRAG
jgi:hypothetical protein